MVICFSSSPDVVGVVGLSGEVVCSGDSSSSVSGTGTHKLQEGSNNIRIVVTAPSGNTTTYTIQFLYPL